MPVFNTEQEAKDYAERDKRLFARAHYRERHKLFIKGKTFDQHFCAKYGQTMDEYRAEIEARES